VDNVASTGIKILENTHSENNVLPKMNYSQKKNNSPKATFSVQILAPLLVVFEKFLHHFC
jgi:hypothetical protein